MLHSFWILISSHLTSSVVTTGYLGKFSDFVCFRIGESVSNPSNQANVASVSFKDITKPKSRTLIVLQTKRITFMRGKGLKRARIKAWNSSDHLLTHSMQRKSKRKSSFIMHQSHRLATICRTRVLGIFLTTFLGTR